MRQIAVPLGRGKSTHIVPVTEQCLVPIQIECGQQVQLCCSERHRSSPLLPPPLHLACGSFRICSECGPLLDVGLSGTNTRLLGLRRQAGSQNMC